MNNDTGHDLVIATLTTNTAIYKSRLMFAIRITPLLCQLRLTCSAELARQAEDRLERPAKYPATTFPVWSFPAILFYAIHDAMKSSLIEIVVLPS
jgi:hypothetical protein